MRASAVVVAILAVVVAAAESAATQGPRDTAKEHRIEEPLLAMAPAALPVFRDATQAMDAGRFADAERLFRDVLAAAPAFTPAMRRLGGVLVELRRDDEGLSLLRQAIERERSPENLGSLAVALAYRADGELRSVDERKAALGLAREAAAANRDPSDETYHATIAAIAASLDDIAAFRQAAAELARAHPQTTAAHYYAAVAAAIDSRWELAEREIREAERLGLPHDAAEAFLASGVHTRAQVWRYARYTLFLLLAWAAGLLLLFVTGRVLSARTLASIEQADPNSLASGSERTLRSIYRVLITVAGVYYYVSLPFVIVLVIGGTAAVVYAFFVLGHVPIKLVAVLVIGALITVFKMVQSLFIKVDSSDPGRSLDPADAPSLWEVTREVAAAVGTRPVDEIRVTPGTDMAVYERGTAAERHRDTARRILLLGVGLLDGFRQGAFRAVLAHEYGHFVNRDTAGGDVALRVRRDMMKFALAMYQQGLAVAWNLAFQFLRVFDFLFRRISHGATRLQEVIADRMAAQVYGPAAFEEGLRHVIRRDVEFGAAVEFELRHAQDEHRAPHDLYAAASLPALLSLEVERMVEQALARPTTEDDTHPGPADRFRLVQRVNACSASTESSPVWNLFPSRYELTREMSESLKARVHDAAVAGV